MTQPMTASVALEALAARYFDQFFQHIPAMATQLGIHDYDHLLGDLSEAGIRDLAAQTRQCQRELADINPDTLSLRERTDYQLLNNFMADNLLEIEEVRSWQHDAGIHVEFAMASVFFLLVREFAPLPERLKNAASRMRQIPAALDMVRAQLVNPSPISTETAIEMAGGSVGIFGQLAPMMAQQLDDATLRDEVIAAAEQATTALQEFATWLQDDLLPRSHGDFRMGADLYTRKVLRLSYMLDMTPEQVLVRGHQMFESTQRELETLAEEIAPGQDWQSIIEAAKDEHPTATELLPAYEQESAKLRQFLIDHNVLTLPPGEHMEVGETPPFLRPMVPYAAYSEPGPYERDQLGQYWVTTPDPRSSAAQQEAQLREHSNYFMPDLTAHEGYPGHHVQLTFAAQHGTYIRNHVGYNSLFIEGWGLYCEQLMAEVGYYTDKRTRLFYLKEQLKRAARIIVDIGLHCGNMTTDEAIRFMVDKVRLSEDGATGEVKMHCGAPGQKISYQLGKALILDLRAEASQKWGEGFTLQRFHDRLLRSGGIPMKLIVAEFWAAE